MKLICIQCLVGHLFDLPNVVHRPSRYSVLLEYLIDETMPEILVLYTQYISWIGVGIPWLSCYWNVCWLLFWLFEQWTNDSHIPKHIHHVVQWTNKRQNIICWNRPQQKWWVDTFIANMISMRSTFYGWYYICSFVCLKKKKHSFFLVTNECVSYWLPKHWWC